MPVSSIETPFESPFRISERVLSVQIVGSAAFIRIVKLKTKISRKKSFFIGFDVIFGL